MEGVEPLYTKYVSEDDLASTWKVTKLMLLGCTRGDAPSLLPLAKSWLRAPKMTCAGNEVEYDVTQRAYVFDASSSSELKFEMDASEENPANGVCVIIENLQSTPMIVEVDGVQYPDARICRNVTYKGVTHLIWLPLNTTDKTVVCLK